MNRLLDISRQGGYPLCAETLQLLHENVQLLETILNGLKLPQHTIVRFPYGDYVYVQSCNPASGNGEILKITSGANLANSAVHSYIITTTSQSIVDVNEQTFSDVYETKLLTLSTSLNNFQSVKVYDFNEVLMPAMFMEYGHYGIYYDDNNASQYISVASGGSCYFKENGDIAKIRVDLSVSNLPDTNEILCLFDTTSFQIGLRGIKAMIYDSDSQEARCVDAFIRRTNNRLSIVINSKEFYEQTGNYVHNGFIEINEVITL